MAADQDWRDAERRREGWFKVGLTTAALGLLNVGIGVLVDGRDAGWARDASLWLMLGGAALTLAGAALAVSRRPGEAAKRLAASDGRRDRVQRDRRLQLTAISAVTLVFAFVSLTAVEDILGGEGGWADWLRAAIVVMYVWLVAAIIMGWDGRSRRQKRYLDDELSRALRARALTLAFFVLLAGATAAFGLGLWLGPVMAVYALPLVIGAAGMSAGLRYAWLDREAERDG